jgi:hypothetical protein
VFQFDSKKSCYEFHIDLSSILELELELELVRTLNPIRNLESIQKLPLFYSEKEMKNKFTSLHIRFISEGNCELHNRECCNLLVKKILIFLSLFLTLELGEKCT